MDDQLRLGLADRYVLEREVGRGGMATVYRAHDVRHDRAVAIKVLDPDVAATVGIVRFLREIKFGAGLQHPHILPVYDSGETAGFLWFTMPFVDGESLRALLRRERRLPTEQALPIACEAADALDFAHRNGVLHRDIKPDNILLSEGHALVADFGVGRAVDDSLPGDPITGPGIVVGTPTYMAPEQAMGDPMDQRSDIFSLGIVVYEMLVGELPFVGSTTQMLEAKQGSGETPNLRRLRRAVPKAVERAVRKALAPLPAERYQSGAEFGRAMREALLDSAGRRSFRIPPLGAGRRRVRIPLLLLLLGLLVLLVMGGLVAWQRFGTPAGRGVPRRVAVLPFVNLNLAEDEYFAHGITDDMRGKLAELP